MVNMVKEAKLDLAAVSRDGDVDKLLADKVLSFFFFNLSQYLYLLSSSSVAMVS